MISVSLLYISRKKKPKTIFICKILQESPHLEMGRGCWGTHVFLFAMAVSSVKCIKYQILVVVHPHSEENVRLQWGF